MPRIARDVPGGMVFHASRKRVRTICWEKQGQVRVMKKTFGDAPVRILAFCLMPNRWHLLLWPEKDGRRSSSA